MAPRIISWFAIELWAPRCTGLSGLPAECIPRLSLTLSQTSHAVNDVAGRKAFSKATPEPSTAVPCAQVEPDTGLASEYGPHSLSESYCLEYSNYTSDMLEVVL